VSREGAEVTSAGSAFQTRAPATEKARRPTVGSLTAGTHRFNNLMGVSYLLQGWVKLLQPPHPDKYSLVTL